MDYDVVVVGAGFSAIATTINLLGLLPAESSIAIVGDDPGFGRGTAYRSEFHLHRLNVPAARMSVYPDAPGDFVAWLREKGRDVPEYYFAARGDYGLYLRDRLAGLLRPRERRTKVDFIAAKATACSRSARGGYRFELDDRSALEARCAVLCLGVGSATLPVKTAGLAPASLSRVIQNPWRLGWLSRVKPTDEIGILGSGLTMVDQVLALRDHGHRGTIHVLSRRGLVPRGHSHSITIPTTPNLPAEPLSISQILKTWRAQVRAGTEWRSLMDGLRPKTQALWQRLDEDQKRRFLRHGLAWWSIHRHRIAPQLHDSLKPLLDCGTVQVHAGYARSVDDAQSRLAITYRRRGRQETDRLAVDWLINCTGMERAGISHSPLLRDMHENSLVALDPLGLGLSVDQQSRLIAPDGRLHENLYAVGALTAGRFWEITAVPDIRNQARQVGEHIAQSLSDHAGLVR